MAPSAHSALPFQVVAPWARPGSFDAEQLPSATPGAHWPSAASRHPAPPPILEAEAPDSLSSRISLLRLAFLRASLLFLPSRPSGVILTGRTVQSLSFGTSRSSSECSLSSGLPFIIAFSLLRDIDDANLGECSNFEHPGDGSQFSTSALESQMQLGALQYPRYPMASDAEHFHFLEILAGTYDSSIKNMRIADNLWNNTQFIAAFPVERVPKHPLSGISTRSGDLARFSFKNMQADRVQRMYIHLLSYQIVTVSGSGVSVLD